jgi:hypothetical protein
MHTAPTDPQTIQSLLHSTLPFPTWTKGTTMCECSSWTTAHCSTTIVPSKLINKLRTLGLNTSLCNWILDFLTVHPQVVRVGNNTSITLLLNTVTPQACVLSSLLYSLFTHDCTARHDSNTIIKFADDTTVVARQQRDSL